MLEDAERCEMEEECEEEREWRERDLLSGSWESSGPPRPSEAMSSTKDGRAVEEVAIESLGRMRRRGRGRRKEKGKRKKRLGTAERRPGGENRGQ